jgi:uncharacterized hydrophobic protein (TIGR00271 family)
MRWISYESPTPPLELRDEMEVAATASVGFYFMLALSASLATLGLITDSSAVIIGAMIIAPLMNPIIAHSFSLARSNRNIWFRSLFSILSGIVLVVAVSYSIASLVGFQLQGREILSRGNPNLLDLAIAIASGMAGAFACSRRKIASALPGVAIAVALVPPLCTAGIAMAMGSDGVRNPNFSNLDEVRHVEWGALLLFFTNFAAILVFGAAVFFVQGYGKLRLTGLVFFLPLLLIIALAFPLARKFDNFSSKGRAVEVLRRLSLNFPDWDDAHLSRMRVEEDESGMVVRLRIEAPAGAIDLTDRDRIAEELSTHFGKPVEVQINLLEYQLLEDDGEGE